MAEEISELEKTCLLISTYRELRKIQSGLANLIVLGASDNDYQKTLKKVTGHLNDAKIILLNRYNISEFIFDPEELIEF